MPKMCERSLRAGNQDIGPRFAVDSTDAPRHALHAVYDALVAAADFYSLRNLHKGGFDYPDAATMYRAYESELFRFDQLYRHFCESADTAEEQGWNIVKPLRVDIEAHYVNWYLHELGAGLGEVHRAAAMGC